MSIFIYQIYCVFPAIKETYVGSTSNFRHRMNQHKSSIKNPQYKVHEFINQNGGWSNWRAHILEELTIENQHQRNEMERYWIEYFDASLNCCLPGRSQKQWIEDNLESHKEQKRTWYRNNFEYIRKKQKLYREQNLDVIKLKHNEKLQCDCGTTYCRSNKSRHIKSDKHTMNQASQMVITI
jgi:hypothetical protein